MIIVKMKYGSHLYGTDTPDSDIDYKGIFLPDKRQIYLGKIPKSIDKSINKSDAKNSPGDIDIEIYSLHYFLKLACEGQTVALDMLHAPTEMILESSKIWETLVLHRSKFYTRNLKAFVGYARRQASKYGIKGSRLNDSKKVIDFLAAFHPDSKLKEVWDDLPEGENIRKGQNAISGLLEYEVCSRKVQAGTKVGYCIDVFTKFYEAYGERARKAANNEDIDWKAMSHAIRAALQVKELLIDNTITFPLKQAQLLKDVKAGKMDYKTEVAPLLESMMDEVEILSVNSKLPKKADQRFWDDFLIQTIEIYGGTS